MPEFDTTFFVALISRFAHILSAIVLAGGLIYLRMMIVPPRQLMASDAGDSETRYFLGLRRRWAVCVMACAALLLASGFYNYIVKVRAEKFPIAYHALFGVKFLLGLFVIFVASMVAGRTEAAQRARERIRTWLNVAIVAAVVVVLIGSTMRTFRGAPKLAEENATARAASSLFLDQDV